MTKKWFLVLEASTICSTVLNFVWRIPFTFTDSFNVLSETAPTIFHGAVYRTTIQAESKVNKAKEEYVQYIDKYTRVRDDFEDKMSRSARMFQRHDENHLRTLGKLIASYAKYNEDSHALSAQVLYIFCLLCHIFHTGTTVAI